MTTTPMMQQYQHIKQQYPDMLLFFRLGDFFELFGDDAETAAKVLEITLTSRKSGADGRIPMCGVPQQTLGHYLEKLMRAGYKVAICDQLEDPKDSKGIVERDVVRVVTPGTFLEANVEQQQSIYLVGLCAARERWGAAVVELSTGEFAVTVLDSWEALQDELLRLRPAEVVLTGQSEPADRLRCLAERMQSTLSQGNPRMLEADHAAELLRRHFAVASLAGFGLDNELAVRAAGCTLDYLQTTQKHSLDHITSIRQYRTEEYLVMDASTHQNLELTRTLREGRKRGSLLWVLDSTVTAMGSRLLRRWIQQPLVDTDAIAQRHGAVERLAEDHLVRLELQEYLTQVWDMERLIGRLASGSGNARDLLALQASLRQVPQVQALLAPLSGLLQSIGEQLVALDALCDRIGQAVVDEPPVSLAEGGIIRPGFCAELDALREASDGGRSWVKTLEADERKRTGIKSLKVRYNKVFGYYIEVTKANLASVPPEYERKQTLTNAERFVTAELKEKEAVILSASERSLELEYDLFCQLREQVRAHIPDIQANAASLAVLDVLQSLAAVASERGYVRPSISTDAVLMIKEGRHPVIEALQSDFVPNSLTLDGDTRIILLTGPNMAGKSTYLRQTALLVIMAQMGSFIPAESACVGLVDRIFTRIGASDDLGTGQSTFMVECAETAHLVINATEQSLVILDELGRGTSTFDGMAIAQATIEYIHQRLHCRTLFSTHYHELTRLQTKLSRLATFRMDVQERDGVIYFVHKVVPGNADRSYGINVAKMAGMPASLTQRAQRLLYQLEARQSKPLQLDLLATLQYPDQIQELSEEPYQAGLAEVGRKLQEIDIEETTPLEALDILARLKEQL